MSVKQDVANVKRNPLTEIEELEGKGAASIIIQMLESVTEDVRDYKDCSLHGSYIKFDIEEFRQNIEEILGYANQEFVVRARRPRPGNKTE